MEKQQIKTTVDSDKVTPEIQQYIDQLPNNEQKTYEIAKNHLESSFSIEKSIGFIKWKQSENSNE